MSVTILSQPGTHTPGYNDQYFVATSTNSNQTGFKYVVAVTIDSDTITERFDKRPDNGLLYFDPSRIVQSYLNNTFDKDSLTPNDAPDSIKYVTVGITEEYGSPVSGFAGASGTYYAWNSAYNTHDFQSYTYSSSTISKDLHLAPSLTETIHIDQKWLFKSWHRGFSTRDLKYLTVEAFDSTGTSIQVTVIENLNFNVGPYTNNYITFNCSPYGLNNCTTINSKSDPILDVIPANTYKYTFYWINAALATSSNTNTVFIDSMCSRYDRYVLHFINRLGNYDSFTFQYLSRHNADKKTLDYKKNPFENVANNLVYYNHKPDTKNYSTTITNKISLNSDWITDAQAVWLKDLLMSPDVILEVPDDTTVVGDQRALYSVKITDPSYETKLKANDKIFNLTVNCEYSYQDIRQRG